jgi:hypothetical protein
MAAFGSGRGRLFFNVHQRMVEVEQPGKDYLEQQGHGGNIKARVRVE